MARVKPKNINPGSSSVKDQLDRFSDFNSNLSRRVASEASRGSKARGLTNSTIAVGAGLGGVLDNASENARAEAGNITQSNIAAAQNATELARQAAADKAQGSRLAAEIESRDRQANAQIEADRVTQEKDLANRTSINDASNLSAEQRAAAANASREAQGAAANASNEAQAAATNASNEAANQVRVDSAETVAEKNIEANVAAAEALALNQKSLQAQADAAARQKAIDVQNLSDESRERMDAARIEANTKAANQAAAQNSWESTQNAIASIDTNASASSQQNQANRIMDMHESRMDYVKAISEPQEDGSPTSIADAIESTGQSVSNPIYGGWTPPPGWNSSSIAGSIGSI